MFRAYLNDHDPLLFVALVHMIKLTREKSTVYTDKERDFFELSLEWINSVILPEGMTPFDWNQEYANILENYSEWNADLINLDQIGLKPNIKKTTKALGFTELEISYVTKNFKIRQHPRLDKNDNVNMLTFWKALLRFNEHKMDFSKNPSIDPLEKDHTLFVFKAALSGSYLSECKKFLSRLWLKDTEKPYRRTKDTVKWIDMARNYEPPTIEESPAAEVKQERQNISVPSHSMPAAIPQPNSDIRTEQPPAKKMKMASTQDSLAQLLMAKLPVPAPAPVPVFTTTQAQVGMVTTTRQDVSRNFSHAGATHGGVNMLWEHPPQTQMLLGSHGHSWESQPSYHAHYAQRGSSTSPQVPFQYPPGASHPQLNASHHQLPSWPHHNVMTQDDRQYYSGSYEGIYSPYPFTPATRYPPGKPY